MNQTYSFSAGYIGYPTYPWIIFLVCINTLISVVILGGNSLVVGAFYTNKKLQTKSNVFLFSLCCADLLTGGVSIQLYSFFLLCPETHIPGLIKFWYAVDILGGVCSILNLLCISLIRAYAVLKPIRFRTKAEKGMRQ